MNVSVRLGLRSKLLVGVFIYLGLLVSVGAMGLYAAVVSLDGMHAALEHHVRELSVLGKLATAVGRAQSTVLLHVLTDSANERAAYEADIAQLERDIEGLLDQEVDLQRSFGDQADIERFAAFRVAWHEYRRVRDEQLLPLSRQDRDAEALAVAQEDGPVDVAYERALAQLTALQASVDDESQERLELAEREFASNRDRLVLALVLAGLFGIGFGLSQSSRLAAAVRAVSNAARQVADGDFRQHLSLRTGDELESLAESFNVMTTNLQRMQDEQHAVERMKDEFVSMVSHELRTPLNGVIGMTDLLLESDLGPRARTYAEAVQRSGEVLLAIVDDILDLSKIEAGKLDLESAPLDVREVVAEVTGLFAGPAQRKGVELTWSVDGRVPANLRGDQIRLRQVLLNLLGNALKFTEAGQVRLRVELTGAGAEQAVVRFEVADTGIGIPPLARERLFEPFSQADSSITRRYGGTGLGLPICQRLVQLMGGSLDFDSQPGHGSTFWFTLPLLRAAVALPAPTATAGAQAAQPRIPVAAQTTQRLLVVEDSWMNQQVMLSMLEQLGYPADVVADGRQALAALEQTPYAAVLLDCQMPEMDGYQMASELRRREARDHRKPVPVIAVTASAMAADRERCLAHGMNDHLPKPVRMAELGVLLARWVPAGALEGPQPVAPAVAGPRMAGQVLDLAALAELGRLQRPGRPDLVAAVIERFQADAPRRLAELREAAARGDAVAVRQGAHALKGDSGRLGGNQVRAVSSQIEALARHGVLDGVAELLSALAQALEQLFEALETVRTGQVTCAS